MATMDTSQKILFTIDPNSIKYISGKLASVQGDFLWDSDDVTQGTAEVVPGTKGLQCYAVSAGVTDTKVPFTLNARADADLKDGSEVFISQRSEPITVTQEPAGAAVTFAMSAGLPEPK